MKTRQLIRILIVDPHQDALDCISRILVPAGFQVRSARGAGEAIRLLEFGKIDIIIFATDLPDIKGIDFIKYLRGNFREMEILIITNDPCIDSAIQAIREGAYDYLVKPLASEALIAAVDRMKDKIMRRRQIHEETIRNTYGIIGISAGIARVIENIEKAAAYNANVVIQGESGTGKELVARAIHYASERASYPFVPVNCTAIPETLLESELFGHVRGAFTDARETRSGFFQVADRGTLFLDEIGDASMGMQGKLLRVLQNKEIQVVGSSQAKKIDIRIIAATNKDLMPLVGKKLFREDLYYRLMVIEIVVPPLRERPEDILPLVHFFLRRFMREMRREPPEFNDRALEAMKSYRWPGNVRELENLIQRLLIITDQPVLDVGDLPSVMRHQVMPRNDPIRTLAAVEAEHIQAVLQLTEGNITRAAAILGIDRKTLRQKMKKGPRS
jgi:two-component system, NtrC family, response regulator HydG